MRTEGIERSPDDGARDQPEDEVVVVFEKDLNSSKSEKDRKMKSTTLFGAITNEDLNEFATVSTASKNKMKSSKPKKDRKMQSTTLFGPSLRRAGIRAFNALQADEREGSGFPVRKFQILDCKE